MLIEGVRAAAAELSHLLNYRAPTITHIIVYPIPFVLGSKGEKAKIYKDDYK